jgi:Fe2+ transport system protein FeoA
MKCWLVFSTPFSEPSPTPPKLRRAGLNIPWALRSRQGLPHLLSLFHSDKAAVKQFNNNFKNIGGHPMMTEATKTSPNTKPLDEIPAGTTVRIVLIDAGSGLKNRLAAMGLLAKSLIRVVRNDGAGQIIVHVKESKVILGRGMSHKIFVTTA